MLKALLENPGHYSGNTVNASTERRDKMKNAGNEDSRDEGLHSHSMNWTQLHTETDPITRHQTMDPKSSKKCSKLVTTHYTILKMTESRCSTETILKPPVHTHGR